MKVVSVFVAFLLFSFSSENATDVYKRLTNSLRSAAAVSVAFSMPEAGISGTLYASKDNRYKITLPGRVIVSDGSSVSNYFSARSQVVISNIIDVEGEISPQTILLNFPESMRPTLLKVNGRSGPGEIWLRLEPEEHSIPVEEVRIRLDPETRSKVLAIAVDDGLQVRQWDIESLTIHDTVDSTKFELETPPGTRVVDMR